LATYGGRRLGQRQAGAAVSAATLVDGLMAAGIRLSRDGDDFIADVLPGVALEPYRDRIAQCRPALLRLLQKREAIAFLADQLEAGWQWLEAHPQHPEYGAFLSRWLDRLATYEQTYAAHLEQGEESCRAS
jgi:hypothetical protein